MAFTTPLASTVAAGIITSGINTTGAVLLVVAIANGSGSTQTVTDLVGINSNTWNSLTRYGSTRSIRMFWCVPTFTGSGHTFSVVGSDGFAAIAVQAWSSAAASPFDQESGASGVTSPGSITPAEDNELFITAINNSDAGGQTVDLSFTISDQVGNGATYGLAMAYLVETTAAAKNPTWSPGNNAQTAMATFKAASAAAGVMAHSPIVLSQAVQAASTY